MFPCINKEQLLLYAITDRAWLNGGSLYEAVEESLKGGVTCLQLREKNLDAERFLEEAQRLKPLCRSYNVPLIINDNVDVALKSDADGVHIGQSGGDIVETRARIGHDKILGVSASTVEEALEAERAGADYLGVGAVFPTSSKNDAENVSLSTLRDICNAVSIPVVAIGGITFDNVSLLTDSGICGIAVISAIYAQKNIQNAAKRLKAKAERYFGS
ncbi:MAG: thiamine phosphate synthase [Opitutales bacterium]|nr:thiamine phosphate synthase [Opitutales bacterium]